MSRYIDADDFAERMLKIWDTAEERKKMEIVSVIANIVIPMLVDTPTANVVSKELFEQVKWERDIAIGQVREIGCELGQKMDDVKAKLDAVPVHGRWENDENDIPRCSNCSYIPEFNRYLDDYYYSDFCPNCGADMREREENDSGKSS